LLRREFLTWRGWKRKVPEVARNVLVTLGGSDPANVTLKVLQALNDLAARALEAVVVVGADNPHHEILQSAVRDLPIPVRLACHVTNMPPLMAWADVAVSAGGSGVWELSFMGVPVLGLIRADQERRLLQACAREGIAVNLGWYQTLGVKEITGMLVAMARNKIERSAMARTGRVRVDGFGSRRVVHSMRNGK